MTLARDRLRLSHAAVEQPHGIALVDEVGVLTWRAAAEEVGVRAAQLRDHGFDPRRDRALVVPTPSREGVLTLWTFLEMNADLVLVHPRWSAGERTDAIERTAPRLVLEDSQVVATLETGRAVRRASSGATASRTEPAPGTDVAPGKLVVFTSGTSGRPKGVCLSRAAMNAAAAAHAEAMPWRDGDRWLLAMPLAHVGGLSVVTRCLWARAPLAIGPVRLDPHVLVDSIRRHRATHLSLVPTLLERLVAARLEAPPSLRAALLGGAACPRELLEAGRAAGWPLLPTYGASETCAQVCTQRLGAERPDGVGPPLPGIAVRIVHHEIQVSGPTLCDGFVDDLELPLERGGWYRTGDLGFLDDAGHLHVRGRVDARIVTGGENVDPIEVEHALRTYPGVVEACVVGLPDPEWGERVAAVVESAAPLDERSVRDHLSHRLAGFKHPRRWMFVRALPLTPSGKVDRRAARSLFERSR